VKILKVKTSHHPDLHRHIPDTVVVETPKGVVTASVELRQGMLCVSGADIGGAEGAWELDKAIYNLKMANGLMRYPNTKSMCLGYQMPGGFVKFEIEVAE